MTHTEYADKLVEEYHAIIGTEISRFKPVEVRRAAIICAIKQVEAQINLTEPGDSNDLELTESLIYLKSLL